MNALVICYLFLPILILAVIANWVFNQDDPEKHSLFSKLINIATLLLGIIGVSVTLIYT